MADLPPSIRIGSPVIERTVSPPQESSPSSNTPLSASAPARSRISSLFARADSNRRQQTLDTPVSPIGSDVGRRRRPYDSPVTPPTDPFRPAYPVPSASDPLDPPAPPTFPASHTTSYDPGADRVSALATPVSPRVPRTRSLLSKLGSIRSSRIGSQKKYGALNEDEQGILHGAPNAAYLRGVQEEDDEEYEHIGVDISGFGGPFALRDMSEGKGLKRAKTTTARDGEDLDEAGFAAEYERLESRSKGGGELGMGMMTVVEAPFLGGARGPDPDVLSSVPGVDEGAGSANVRDVAQKVAEERGEILVLTDRATIDIGHLGGDGYASRTDLESIAENGTSRKNAKSYYFPPDPDMPNWRPFSMHWAYILFLTILALFLAGLQEFLCQLSQRLAEKDDGLLKFKQAQEVSTGAYFIWKYLPIIFLLTYGIMWQIVDFEVKRLEPFYQLSKKAGATAAESLNMDYLTFMSYLTPFKAIRYRQWAVTYSSLATLLAGGLVPILQSGSVNLTPDKDKRRSDEFKFVRIDPGWSRAMTAALGCVALCGVLLLFQLRRKSGLLSDPKGIAGIAAMATRSHILNDFRGLDREPHHVIHKQLKNRRYILHKSSLWQGEYIQNAVDSKRSERRSERRRAESPHPIMLTLKAGIPFITFMLAFAALIPVFVFVKGAHDATETLPFLLTALATAIKLLWNTFDCDVRIIQPLYLLSLRHAPPRTLTLDYTGTVPGWITIKAALNRHFLVAVVGLGSILAEVLTVCVSSFSVDGRSFLDNRGNGWEDTHGSGPPPPNKADLPSDLVNSGETFNSFWISLVLAETILLSLCGVATLVYLRRRHHFLPREPGTIASVLAFIHQSKMLLDFVGAEKLDSRAMTAHLEGLKKTYGLGWFEGRDEEDHCGIEQEELFSGYRHGVDWSEGRLKNVGVSDWERYD